MYKKKLKKVTAAILALSLTASIFVSNAFAVSSSDFSDINNSSAKEALVKAVNNGLLNGNNGKLRPEDPLLRAQMAAILNRAFGSTEKADISAFKDVPTGKWYADDMAKAVKMGTFEGTGKNLAPEKTISRQDAFTVLSRAFKLTAADLSSLNQFSDKVQISGYAQEAIAALAEGGYLAKGKLNPRVNMTRAEFAEVMDKLVSVYLKDEGTYTTLAEGNVLINKENVVLKNVTVSGDLIIGDGVGKGDVTLDGVKILGRTIIRGGGSNSIHVINGSSINGKVIIDNVNNQVRIVTDKATTVQNMEAGSQVILEGSYNAVSITGNSSKVEVKGDIKTFTVNAKTEVLVSKGTITNVDIKANAAGTLVTVEKDAKIENVVTEAKTEVKGEGKVTKVEAKANDVKVETKGTEVKAVEGISGVTAGGKPVEAGKSLTTETEVPVPIIIVPAPTVPTTPPAQTEPTVVATGASAVVNGQRIYGTISGSTASIKLSGNDSDILTVVSIEAPSGSYIESPSINNGQPITGLDNIPVGLLHPLIRDNDVRLGTLRSIRNIFTISGTLKCPGYTSSNVIIEIDLSRAQ